VRARPRSLPLSLTLIAWSGLLAGAVHVVSGVDHLAALLPLSVGRRARAFAIGARWGVGHSAGVMLIALLAVALRERLDLEVVGVLGERVVGVMLIVLGAFGLRSALRITIHAHPHGHAQDDHAHLHLHGPQSAHADAEAGALHRHSHAAFVAGTLHGIAGTAHVLGVLPAVAMPTALDSGAYLAAFALGTILAMGGFAAVVGATSARAGGRGPAALKLAMSAASLAAILVGVAWIVLPLAGVPLPG
jgi:hypothetical protein